MRSFSSMKDFKLCPWLRKRKSNAHKKLSYSKYPNSMNWSLSSNLTWKPIFSWEKSSKKTKSLPLCTPALNKNSSKMSISYFPLTTLKLAASKWFPWKRFSLQLWYTRTRRISFWKNNSFSTLLSTSILWSWNGWESWATHDSESFLSIPQLPWGSCKSSREWAVASSFWTDRLYWVVM